MRRGLPWHHATVLMVALWAATAALWAERLPVRTFTVAEGLAGDEIRCIYEDSRGFLWVGTSTGVSRFDGTSFVNYTTFDGLPHPAVSVVAEDASGGIWMGTPAGLAIMSRVRSADGVLFRLATFGRDPLENMVRDLLPDPAGGMWVAAGSGLYRVESGAANPTVTAVELDLPPPPNGYREVRWLGRGAGGVVWASVVEGFVRVGPRGDHELFRRSSGRGEGLSLLSCDRTHRLWASEHGEWLLDTAPWEGDEGGRPLADQALLVEPARRLDHSLRTSVATWSGDGGLPTAGVTGLADSRDGGLWVASVEGLFRIEGGTASQLTERHGLVSRSVSAVLEDTHGTLWLGTHSHGLQRVDRNGFYSYGRAEGLATEAVTALVPDPAGGVLAIGSPPSTFVHRLVDGHFVPIRIPISQRVTKPGWGWGQVTLVDRCGECWVPTGQGLFRFPRVGKLEDLATARPIAAYRKDDGLGSSDIFRLFEDSRGDLWVSALGPVAASRWERSTGRLVPLNGHRGFPPDAPTAFAEDPQGRVWVGFYRGGLGYFEGGAFRFFPPGDDVPLGFVSALFFDHAGRLWVATLRGGVARRDRDGDGPERWVRFGLAEGLATSSASCFAEDEFGRIYVGTLAGIDRIDLERGITHHFDTSSGLINNIVLAALRDEKGDLWFATNGGVSRMTPRDDGPGRPPRVLVTGVRADGRPVEVPELGTDSVDRLSLPSSVHNLELTFAAISLASGERVRFQYAVDGEGQRWSPPFVERRLHLAGLTSGAHKVLLRAVTSAGTSSPIAKLSFSIRPPVWKRWWFVLLAATLVLFTAALLHRQRIGRLKEVHAMRERIAGDLHDELGLSLSRISILAEVARATGDDPETRDQQLGIIGETARDLMDVTGDVVWAVDPASDSLRSVLGRVRRTASDVFERAGIAFELTVSPPDADAFLDGEARRQLLLVLKEAMHNARRHARPSRVQVRVRVVGRTLAVEVADDGCGFLPENVAGAGGKGLGSMVGRGTALGGRLTVESAPGRGTRVRLEMPLPAVRSRDGT